MVWGVEILKEKGMDEHMLTNYYNENHITENIWGIELNSLCERKVIANRNECFV